MVNFPRFLLLTTFPTTKKTEKKFSIFAMIFPIRPCLWPGIIPGHKQGRMGKLSALTLTTLAKANMLCATTKHPQRICLLFLKIRSHTVAGSPSFPKANVEMHTSCFSNVSACVLTTCLSPGVEMINVPAIFQQFLHHFDPLQYHT